MQPSLMCFLLKLAYFSLFRYKDPEMLMSSARTQTTFLREIRKLSTLKQEHRRALEPLRLMKEHWCCPKKVHASIHNKVLKIFSWLRFFVSTLPMTGLHCWPFNNSFAKTEAKPELREIWGRSLMEMPLQWLPPTKKTEMLATKQVAATIHHNLDQQNGSKCCGDRWSGRNAGRC